MLEGFFDTDGREEGPDEPVGRAVGRDVGVLLFEG